MHGFREHRFLATRLRIPVTNVPNSCLSPAPAKPEVKPAHASRTPRDVACVASILAVLSLACLHHAQIPRERKVKIGKIESRTTLPHGGEGSQYVARTSRKSMNNATSKLTLRVRNKAIRPLPIWSHHVSSEAYPSTSLTTCPWTSVRRRSIPFWRNVSRS